MSAYLVELAFGPVQGFINAARRSRDLWAGSYMLSEVARAAAKSLLESGAELIYPISGRVLGESEGEHSNLSNVLLARIPDTDEAGAAQVIADAHRAARVWLEGAAASAWNEWTSHGVELRLEIWTRQVEDAIDAYGAWAREGTEGYRAAYDGVKAALASRKSTRNFAPMFAPAVSHPGCGVPKSSLDGLRESVLPRGRSRFPIRFGVGPGEQLDALGCIKRVLGLQERFTALTRLAADGWLQQLSVEQLATLCKAYEPLKSLGLATGANGNEGVYRPFAFDGGLLFPERLEHALSECEAQAKPALLELKACLGALQRAGKGRPCPYAVLVVADGDRMGRFIDKARTADEHTRISQAVAAFADKVPDIARQFRGHCVFNGGEDLTVLFPLSGVVGGAHALSAAFNLCMKSVVDALLQGDRDALPTLRVGAAICHVMEPLGVIRSFGDSAEKYAKGAAGTDAQGNALGLSLHVRAGHEVRSRMDFSDDSTLEAFNRWMAAYRDGSLPGGLAYEIRAARLRSIASGLGDAVSQAEFDRVLMRANQRGEHTSMDSKLRAALASRKDVLARVDGADGFLVLVDELIMARWLSANTEADVNAQGGRR